MYVHRMYAYAKDKYQYQCQYQRQMLRYKRAMQGALYANI